MKATQSQMSDATVAWTDDNDSTAGLSAAVESLQTELELERRGNQETRAALIQSAEVGQLLLSRNQLLEDELEALRQQLQCHVRQPTSDVEPDDDVSALKHRNLLLDAECHRLEAELERLAEVSSDRRSGLRFNRSASGRLRRVTTPSDSEAEDVAIEELREKMRRSELLVEEHRNAAHMAEEHSAVLEEKVQSLEQQLRSLKRSSRRQTRFRTQEFSQQQIQAQLKAASEAVAAAVATSTVPTARARWQSAGRAINNLFGHKLGTSKPETSEDSDSESKESVASSRLKVSKTTTDSRVTAELKARIESLEAELSGQRVRNEALAREKATLKSHIKDFQEDSATLRNLLSEEMTRAEVLNDEVATLRSLLESQAADEHDSTGRSKPALSPSQRKSICVLKRPSRRSIASSLADADDDDEVSPEILSDVCAAWNFNSFADQDDVTTTTRRSRSSSRRATLYIPPKEDSTKEGPQIFHIGSNPNSRCSSRRATLRPDSPKFEATSSGLQSLEGFLSGVRSRSISRGRSSARMSLEEFIRSRSASRSVDVSKAFARCPMCGSPAAMSSRSKQKDGIAAPTTQQSSLSTMSFASASLWQEQRTRPKLPGSARPQRQATTRSALGIIKLLFQDAAEALPPPAVPRLAEHVLKPGRTTEFSYGANESDA
jgi:hypothetical protein